MLSSISKGRVDQARKADEGSQGFFGAQEESLNWFCSRSI